MTFLSEKQFEKIIKSIDWSIRQFDFPRRKRLEAIKQFTGYHYFDGGSEKKMPVPMTALSVIIYQRLLAPQSPRILTSTRNDSRKPIAANLELAINQIPDEIDFATTLRKMVSEALFSPMGIVKVGLASTGSVLGQQYGQPFVDLVTLDDYFCDMSATRDDQLDYEGNDYWLDYENVINDESFKIKGDKLEPDKYKTTNTQGQDRAESIAIQGNVETYRDKLWLRDVYIPKDNCIMTYHVTSKQQLRVRDWNEDFGPYQKLRFLDVPGNLLALPPVSLWRDLDELGNALFRKLAAQADSQKTVLGFPGGNDESVKNLRDAKDLAGISYQGGEPREFNIGGINRETLAFQMHVRELSSYIAGNLDSLGGLGAITQTATQDKLISESAGAQLRDMADAVIETTKKIFKILAHFEWTDPIKRRMLTKGVPGTDLSIPVEFGTESKQGDFSDFDIDIDIYSLQDESPQIKLQKLQAFVSNIVMPLAPLLQQIGATPNVQKIIEDAAHWSGLDRGGEYVQFMENTNQTSAGPESTGMPAQTSREYIRTGRPGQTRQGASQMMQQILMGGNPGGNQGG